MLSISDGSTDPLLARFKLLEETVDKLHRENRTLKTKLQGYNTLSTFYHEARQQMRTLNLQLAAKDTVIQRLQAHHTRSPAEDPHMDPSKSLVENLMDHLNKMREQLKETERLSREKVDALNQEIQRLNQQLAEKDGQIHQMSSWPPHEKEMEICRLQRSLAEKERVQATSEVLCRTLSDETHQLRRKLATTAEMCQHLVRLLEETHGSEIQNVNELANKNTENVNDVSQDKLREEILLLKKKVVHVEDLNAKWQKYDASREEYVKGLLLQLKEMKTQHEQQKGPHTGRLHIELLQKEINRLNKLLEEKMKESAKLKEEAEDMGRARLADGEHIQMLEQQLLVYKDDFTSERADRERAQSRIQELCEEIARLKQQTRKPDEKQSGGSSQIHAGNKNKAVIPKNEAAESRRKATSAECAEGRGNSSSERRVQDELQCPLCLRVFQDKLGENFLEHISECCQ